MQTKFMKYIKVFTIIISYLLFLTGCNEGGSGGEIIKVNLDKNIRSNFSVTVESVIDLETTKNSLIGDIEKIEYFEDKIYILDNTYSKSLFLFDKKGNFISKTNIGHGPGEVISPWSFIIDKQNRIIMLWDQNLSSMILFDLELNYLSTQKHSFLVRDFAKLGRDTFLVMSYRLKEKKEKKELTTYTVYSDGFHKTHGNFLPVRLEDETQNTRKPISINKRNLFIKPWDYNVYNYNNKKIQIIYTWDFGKYMFKTSNKENITNSQKWDIVKSGKKIGPLFNLSESNNYLSAAGYFKNGIKTFVYSKKSKKAIQLNNYSVPECLIGNIIKDDLFLGIVTDPNYGKRSLRDNPVLITLKISEFSNQ